MNSLTPVEQAFLLRYDFTTFLAQAFSELNPQTELYMAPYIELMASKLEACRTGQIKRLIINIPPRCLKSHCASIALPAFILGHDPSRQIICASYGQDLSDKLARDTRRLMTSPWYKATFPARLAADKTSAHDFETTMKGGRMATSVGGVLTGRGGDFIIIDDPMKPDEALNEARRASVNNWYDNTLRSRLNSKRDGCIIIIMQRLHQDDLVGHVLGTEDWDVVSFPAIAEADERVSFDTIFGPRVYSRRLGEPLHVEREPIETVEMTRKTLGEYNFNSQYQQNPMPQEGAMIKQSWLRFYEPGNEPSRFDYTLQSWDTANKTGEMNDYSVCTTWGIKKSEAYLLHLYRQKLEYPDLKRAIIEQAHIHKPTSVIIEDKASGTQLIQDLRYDRLYNVKAAPRTPGQSKVQRLQMESIAFENGLVHLPKDAPWLAEYVKELTTFPGCKHDDQVDSTTQALGFMREQRNMPNAGFFDMIERDMARWGLTES